MYDTKEEFHQKLVGTVVLYNSVPVSIQEALGSSKNKIILDCYKLRTKERETVSAWDPGWDFRTIGSRLGYMNFDYGEGSYRQALYLTRVAVRQAVSTQGLSQKNVKYDGFRPDKTKGLDYYKPTWTQIVQNEGFVDTLERKYPSLTEIYDVFSKEKSLSSKAFHPKFAINKPSIGPFYLEYRGKDIGYSDDLSRWKIGEDYDYLRETLEHINMKVV